MSNKRQVPGAQVGLQQKFGIGGAAVVTLYKKFNSDINIYVLYIIEDLYWLNCNFFVVV